MPFPRGRRKTATPKVPADPKPKPVKKDFIFHEITQEELLPDGTVLCKFTIPGQPATKKNSSRIICRGRRSHTLLPSTQYVAYEDHCKEFCNGIWANIGKEPMNFGVSIEFHVHLKNWMVPDEVGLMQSYGDIFQKWNILSNDLWITWRNEDHWLSGIDAKNPRTEVCVRRMRHPKEDFRQKQEDAEKSKKERASKKLGNCTIP